MCTAVTYQTDAFYFGRNLDLEYSYQESVAVTPRRYPFRFRHVKALPSHYAMIGMSYVVDGYPLYYEATNEKGISMAGLNFPGHAVYRPQQTGWDNIVPFEFIPWMLGQCDCMADVHALLGRVNLVAEDLSPDLPAAPLHWLIASREGALVVEPMAGGLRVFDDPVGVLTNNPPFPYHRQNLVNYMGLSTRDPENRFGPGVDLTPHSRGMGALGLPGDLSSPSRFVRAAFTRANSRSGAGEMESVSQVFHILQNVAMPRGLVDVGGGKLDVTQYTSCCNADTGVYYYTTYENSGLTAVALHKEDLEGSAVVSYPMVKTPQVRCQN